MELKLELNPTSPNGSPKEIKTQQVINCLIGDKLVDSFGNYNKDIEIEITSQLTEDDFNKAHNTVALTCRANFSLFKPNFKMDLLNKLFTAVFMGEQYPFSTQVLTQTPSELDKKEVLEKRKILFISKDNQFQIGYCTDDWDYAQIDVTDEKLKNTLERYKDNKPTEHQTNLTVINQILTRQGIRTQQDRAERLLKTSPELMLEKTTFTDCSGRTFSNISVFEFVLWALDTRYMVNMMFNCLPKDENGLKLVKELGEQYRHHQEHGVTYTLEGQTITEKHFDFSVLINALQDYVDNYDNWKWLQREAHWSKVVGMALRYVPAHVMQHYFNPNVPFNPLPKFDAEQFIRTLKFHNYLSKKEESWAGVTSSSDSVLGENFGIAGALRGLGSVMNCTASIDLAAVTALCKVRTSDYLAIPSKLASLFATMAAADETPNSCGIR